MTYIMVDVEADGPIPGDYSMVCFGAIVVEPALDRTFYGRLKPISEEWIPEALQVSGFTREETLGFDDPKAVMRQFAEWVAEVGGGRPMFISDNNGFDWQFVNWYFHHFLGNNPFGHSSTNLGSLYKGVVRDMFVNFKHLRKTKHTHHPVDDVRGDAEALLQIKESRAEDQFQVTEDSTMEMHNHSSDGRGRPSRRTILQQGAFLLAGAAFSRVAQADEDEDAQKPLVRIGMVTDLHYADKPAGGSRHYRETLRKFEEAAKQFADNDVDFVIELGDFIDAADSAETEKAYLTTITRRFAGTPGQHHYVLGNHCVQTLTKGEFLEIVGQPESYYAFDVDGYHFVVLDACFRSDGEPYGRKNFNWTDSNIPAAEVEWLKDDLEKTPNKAIVFVHQRLDVEGHYGVKNAAEVRRVLEESGKVLAVFQGHYHRNDLKEIGGIRYCTLAAMVEGAGPDANAYSVLDILPGDAIRITGFGAQKSYGW